MVISNISDTALLQPVASAPGLIQAAQRMSELSKLCPQVAGLNIDDFLLNFRDEGGKHGAENISGCVTCPDTHPFSYGDDDNGAHTTRCAVCQAMRSKQTLWAQGTSAARARRTATASARRGLTARSPARRASAVCNREII